VCADFLYNKGDTPCVADPVSRMCYYNNIKITGLAYTVDSAASKCSDVGLALYQLIAACENKPVNYDEVYGGKNSWLTTMSLVHVALIVWIYRFECCERQWIPYHPHAVVLGGLCTSLRGCRSRTTRNCDNKHRWSATRNCSIK
jgi:hypothetical protein